MEYDELDLQITQELRRDGRITIKELADNLGRRRATIHNRIEKLQENGGIKGYTVIPDFRRMDRAVTVFILAAISKEEYEEAESFNEITKKITTLPYITEVHSITGQWDYLIKARVPDLETLGNEVNFKLNKLFGVDRSITLASFHSELEELTNSPIF